ncbi:nucleotidyltransferase family protein [Symplocastrum sp. BBK-W-15]|uniref:Nucleotidyltransferase family protein n=2 Tax=Limnofasciculus TaxID=3064905 RepID=A0AAE3KK81_9CYAN|nr:nucleotidyltransferase family protein [Limnofasciculus baicalensis BBK-W-15]
MEQVLEQEIKGKTSAGCNRPESGLGKHTRPEIELLLCCSRTSIEPAIAARIKILLQQEIDWKYLLQTAAKHGVKPLLYQSLSTTAKELVPPEILTQLRQDFRTNAVRNLNRTKELLKILDLFAVNDIPVFTFKGPAIASLAYGELSLRQFGDLDILVRDRDIIRARDLFLSQGDEMKVELIELTEAQKAIFIKSPQIHEFVRECAYPFIRQQSKIIVELHWRMMPLYFSFPIDSENLWERLIPVPLLGTNILTTSPEDSLLLLCGHGIKECWDKLNRVCDIAALVHKHPNLDWDRVMAEAARLGCQRILFLGLFLAKELLGTALPEFIWEKIEADGVVTELAVQVYDGFFPNGNISNQSFPVTRLHLKARERFIDKVRYFLLVMITPTTSDWLVLPLGRYPSFLYYLIRPIRLVGELLRGK